MSRVAHSNQGIPSGQRRCQREDELAWEWFARHWLDGTVANHRADGQQFSPSRVGVCVGPSDHVAAKRLSDQILWRRAHGGRSNIIGVDDDALEVCKEEGLRRAQEEISIGKLRRVRPGYRRIWTLANPEHSRDAGLAVELGQADRLHVRPEPHRATVARAHLKGAVPAAHLENLYTHRGAARVVPANQGQAIGPPASDGVAGREAEDACRVLVPEHDPTVRIDDRQSGAKPLQQLEIRSRQGLHHAYRPGRDCPSELTSGLHRAAYRSPPRGPGHTCRGSRSVLVRSGEPGRRPICAGRGGPPGPWTWQGRAR